MTQEVRTTDQHHALLFIWDANEQIISVRHGKRIWYIRIRKDGWCETLTSKSKPYPPHERPYADT